MRNARLELAQDKFPLESESSASTNSASPAGANLNHTIINYVLLFLKRQGYSQKMIDFLNTHSEQ